MIRLYIWDIHNIYVSFVDISPKEAVPLRSTLIAPPELSGEEVARWVGDGWAVLESRPVAPEPARMVPHSCTRRQARLALLQVGKLDEVEQIIADIPDPTQRRAAEIEYEADTWERHNPTLQTMWAAMGGTEMELDDLFQLADTL